MEGLSENIQKCRPYLLMIFLQFGAAGTYIVIMATLNQGQNRYVLIVYRNAIAALVLAPFALYFERSVYILNNHNNILFYSLRIKKLILLFFLLGIDFDFVGK